jgi:hypothetical protein
VNLVQAKTVRGQVLQHSKAHNVVEASGSKRKGFGISAAKLHPITRSVPLSSKPQHFRGVIDTHHPEALMQQKLNLSTSGTPEIKNKSVAGGEHIPNDL